MCHVVFVPLCNSTQNILQRPFEYFCCSRHSQSRRCGQSEDCQEIGWRSCSFFIIQFCQCIIECIVDFFDRSSDGFIDKSVTNVLLIGIWKSKSTIFIIVKMPLLWKKSWREKTSTDTHSSEGNIVILAHLAKSIPCCACHVISFAGSVSSIIPHVTSASPAVVIVFTKFTRAPRRYVRPVAHSTIYRDLLKDHILIIDTTALPFTFKTAIDCMVSIPLLARHSYLPSSLLVRLCIISAPPWKEYLSESWRGVVPRNHLMFGCGSPWTWHGIRTSSRA